MSSAADRSRERGFLLVEVLCALIIAVLAVVMLTNGTLGSLRGARQIDKHLGARVMLQSILEDELSTGETLTGKRSGEAGPYRWRLEITPEAVDLPRRLPASHRLYRLSAVVSWGRGSLVSASVLKFSR